MTHTHEREIIYRALSGDQQAFRALYVMHYPRIHRIIAPRSADPEEAKDLLQVTFMRAFRALVTFRGESSFSTWLTRIALNVCTTHFCSRKARRCLCETTLERDYDLRVALEWGHGEDPAEILHRKECRQLVHESIRSLREPYRQALWLRYIQDRTYTEITDELNVPLGTVKTWLCRGRRQLRAEVERQGVEVL